MNKQSLSKNFIFQLFYQGLVLVIPLVLSPYLTRTLKETALGNYTFANSIAYYFVIIANLGISRHGQRIISQSSGDTVKLRREFWSLFALHAAVSAVSAIAYILYVVCFVHDYKEIYFIEIMYVLSALFDITWLFYGLENFKSVVIKNGLVKVAECALIFLFVKKPSDVGLYTAICAGGILIGQAVMIPQAVKSVKPIRFRQSDVVKHIKPLLVFSVAVIAATLYTVFDKTLLGILSSKENVAFYEYSNRIVIVPRSIVSVVGTVMFPRACRLASEGDVAGQKRYINYSVLFTAFVGIGSVFGLLAVAELFATLYYGASFAVCGSIMIALSPLVYVIGMGDILRTQYMIPNGMDKQYNICIILNAVVNIILSVALIPVIGVYGAVVGTVSAELFGIVYQMILCKKFIKVSDLISSSLPFAVIGAIMFIAVRLVSGLLTGTLTGLIIEIIVGLFVYCLLSACYIIVFRKDIWRMLLTKIRRKS